MNTQKALELINQSVRDLQAYHLSPEVVAIKLNQNENPFDWPAEVKDAAAEFCRTRPWNRYPEFVPGTLKELVASYAGLRAENVIVGNGSNEMLLTLLLALTTPERTVIISQPTFTVYQLLTRGLGRRETAVYMRPDLQFDTDALLEAIRNDPEALVILCSPNNPTGGTLGEKEIRRLLEAHRGMMILDQAYIEFGGYNAVPLLSEYSNLIVTRTFSKALGAAGLRLGYMLGTAEVIEQINKIKLPYNIDFFSEHVARTILSNRELIHQRVRQMIATRDELFAALEQMPLQGLYASAANFVLVRVEKHRKLGEWLRRKGILVRDVSKYPMLENCLRLSVGTPEENAALIGALQEYFAG